MGTAERLAELLAGACPEASLVWNPEFLREGFAVADTLHPDRLVYGIESDDERAVAVLDEVYAVPIAEGTPRRVMDPTTAQLVKVAANSFLATKISFINADLPARPHLNDAGAQWPSRGGRPRRSTAAS